MNALTEYWYEPENCLFHVFESDDLHLSCDEDAVWFRGVEYIYRNWEEFLSAAVKYYESLYQFNKDKTSSYRQNASHRQSGEPNREDAGLDMLFKRPTGSSGETAKVQKVETPPETVDPLSPTKSDPVILR